MARKPAKRSKAVSKTGLQVTPKVASQRKADYQAAVIRELRRREASEEPLGVSAIVKGATYQGSGEFADGTPINRTTIYAKRDGARVHEALFAAIKEATTRRAALQTRVRRKRSAADYEREIADLKEREVKFANQLLEARVAEEQAAQSARGAEASLRSRSDELYVMCKVIEAVTGVKVFVVRSIIDSFERRFNLENLANNKIKVADLVREIKSKRR